MTSVLQTPSVTSVTVRQTPFTAIVDVTRLGGDVQVRLRPTRHTGGHEHADGGS